MIAPRARARAGVHMASRAAVKGAGSSAVASALVSAAGGCWPRVSMPGDYWRAARGVAVVREFGVSVREVEQRSACEGVGRPRVAAAFSQVSGPVRESRV